jgi:hypothetical protein
LLANSKHTSLSNIWSSGKNPTPSAFESRFRCSELLVDQQRHSNEPNLSTNGAPRRDIRWEACVGVSSRTFGEASGFSADPCAPKLSPRPSGFAAPRRCIVPMNSFFQKDLTGKRYAISRRDGEPFGVAGIWENWNDPASRQRVRTNAIITVLANHLVATIHDRTPAIFDTEHCARWFGDEAGRKTCSCPIRPMSSFQGGSASDSDRRRPRSALKVPSWPRQKISNANPKRLWRYRHPSPHIPLR